MKLRRITAGVALAVSLTGAAAACSSTDQQVINQATGRTLIDVRTPAEYASGHLRGALNADVQSPTFASAVGGMARDGKYFVYCHSGNRAAAAITTMKSLGFTDLINGGGFATLTAAGLPTA